MHRRTATVLASAACAVLAACSASSEGETPGPNLATVTGGGKNLSFSGDPDRTAYPSACPLLPNRSAQALIGAPVKTTRNSIGCTWTPGVASVPSLMVAFVQIGSQASERYIDPVRGSLSAAGLRIGDRSRIYGLDKNRTIRVDVLKDNVFFRVQVRSPLNAAQDVATARSIAIRTGQIVAKQIS